MVAPIKSTNPSSRAGSKASCWVLLKRWTSSTKTSVPRPSYLSRSRAPSRAALRSFTPLVTALSDTNSSSTVFASTRARVVLPVPGGPQRTTEPILPRSTTARNGPPSPVRCGWPTASSSVRRTQPFGQRGAPGQVLDARFVEEVHQVSIFQPVSISAGQHFCFLLSSDCLRMITNRPYSPARYPQALYLPGSPTQAQTRTTS